MGVCGVCEQIIRIDKPILGSLHLCLTESEEQLKARAQWQQMMQLNCKGNLLGNIGSQPAKD